MVGAPAPATARLLDGVIEGVLAGALGPIEAPREGDYHAAWREHALSGEEPGVMAALGGALADRLAWVFMAGYQATLRRCFPGLPVLPGWSAFVNTEGVDGLPGTSVTGEPDNRRLSGWKTWVAGADHVERLLVSARHNELPFIVVFRDEPGVTIERNREGGYLRELVQGRVRFDDVRVTEDRITGDEHTFPTFRAAEGAYVRVALNAFMLAHAVRLRGAASLIGGAAAGLLAAARAVELPLPSNVAAIALGGVDAQTRTLAGGFESFISNADPALHERWLRDRRLVTGSDALARRAEQALAAPGLVLPRPSSA